MDEIELDIVRPVILNVAHSESAPLGLRHTIALYFSKIHTMNFGSKTTLCKLGRPYTSTWLEI